MASVRGLDEVNWLSLFSVFLQKWDAPTAKRDVQAAKRFFRKALKAAHNQEPRVITVDKNAAYPKAIDELKAKEELSQSVELRQKKYLNNIIEQDHRGIKRLVKPGMGFGSFNTARRTIRGYEIMNMMGKKWVGTTVSSRGHCFRSGTLVYWSCL